MHPPASRSLARKGELERMYLPNTHTVIGDLAPSSRRGNREVIGIFSSEDSKRLKFRGPTAINENQ